MEPCLEEGETTDFGVDGFGQYDDDGDDDPDQPLSTVRSTSILLFLFARATIRPTLATLDEVLLGSDVVDDSIDKEMRKSCVA
jgi:hypothetical protein